MDTTPPELFHRGDRGGRLVPMNPESRTASKNYVTTAWIAFSDEITSGHTMAIQWSISGLKIRASRLLNLEERFLLYGSSSPVG
jgi:hypothetical protein